MRRGWFRLEFFYSGWSFEIYRLEFLQPGSLLPGIAPDSILHSCAMIYLLPSNALGASSGTYNITPLRNLYHPLSGTYIPLPGRQEPIPPPRILYPPTYIPLFSRFTYIVSETTLYTNSFFNPMISTDL